MTAEELKKQVMKVTKIDRTAFLIFALAMVGGMISIPFTKSYNIPGAVMIAIALVFFVLHITCSPSPLSSSPSSFIVPAKAMVRQESASPSRRISGVAVSHMPL